VLLEELCYTHLIIEIWESLKTVIPNLISYLICLKYEIVGQARNDKIGFLEMLIYKKGTILMKENREQMIQTAIVNLQKTQENLKLPTKAIKRLFSSFVISAYAHSQEMLVLVGQGDATAIKAKAHAIRGVALTLCFEGIGTLCHSLEYEYEKLNTPQETIQTLHNALHLIMEAEEEILARVEG